MHCQEFQHPRRKARKAFAGNVIRASRKRVRQAKGAERAGRAWACAGRGGVEGMEGGKIG